jgi:hypothetical protein
MGMMCVAKWLDGAIYYRCNVFKYGRRGALFCFVSRPFLHVSNFVSHLLKLLHTHSHFYWLPWESQVVSTRVVSSELIAAISVGMI